MRGYLSYSRPLFIMPILKTPNKIWEIIISIYILGLINMYIIHIYGLESTFPIEIVPELNNIFWEKINCGGIIKINENNILFLIFLNILFLFIFNSSFNILNTDNTLSINSIEFIFLISFGLLGLNIITISNDLIFIFIAIELYSLSTYLLILLKINKNSSRLSIIYLLINSLSSYTFLLGIAFLYKYTGSIILDEILYIYNTNIILSTELINNIMYGILLIIIGILLKLGTVPFNFWVLRLYTVLENRILLYQILIPKLVFIFLLYKILYFFFLTFEPITQDNLYYLNLINYFFFFIAILSVIVGSIAGLFHSYFKALLTYSSILNIGFILLGLSNEFIKYSYFNINSNWEVFIQNNFIEYLFIYCINTLALFFCFILINPIIATHANLIFLNSTQTNSSIKNRLKLIFNIAYYFPFFSLFLIFSIFSFIGIPPFAGFYAKLNIIMNIIYSYNSLWMVSIILLLISTFISACFYLKFILFFFYNITTPSINTTHDNFLLSVQTNNKPFSITYLFSFFSLFLIFYPLLSNYIYPFFYGFNSY